MKMKLTLLAALAIIALPALAEDKGPPACTRLTPISERKLDTYSEPIVLTPTNLYDQIVKSKKEVLTVMAKQYKTQAKEIADLKAQIKVNRTDDIDSRNKQKEIIAELERKVAGMQKQITVLHAKKADKQ